MTREELKQIKDAIDKKIEEVRAQRNKEDTLAWTAAMNEALIEGVHSAVLSALSSLEIKAPEVNVEAPQAPEVKVPPIDVDKVVEAIQGITINVPEVKVPEAKVTVDIPPIKLPEINVPEVKIPEIKIPTIKVDVPKVSMPESMNVSGEVGLKGVDNKSPLPVTMLDFAGNPISFPSLSVPRMMKTTTQDPQSLYGHESIGNSSDSPLSASDTFTGSAEQNNFPDVGVSCFSDTDGTLFFDFSVNGDDWRTFPTNGFSVSANIHEFHTAVKLGRYFRVRFVNSASAQSTFQLHTYYGIFRAPNAPVNQSLGTDADANIVRLSNDHKLDLSRSFINGQSVIHKFGANPDIGASSTEDIIFTGTINWLTAATTVRIKAGGNANDSSSGSGAQQVTIEGLDENWNNATETIATNGTSASSATTTTFIRINRAYIGNVGTYTGSNTGNITIENSGGGTDLITIEAGRGQTQSSGFTIPSGKTGYITRLGIISTSSKASDIRFWQRRNADDVTTPFTGKRLIDTFLGFSSPFQFQFDAYPSFPARTDIWASATTASGGAGAVSVNYDLILVDN